MTTIDHAAEALNHLDSASLHLGAEEFAFADILTKRAGVYATLALAEQQRIANLIAAFEMEGGPCREANNWTDGEENANLRICREVREGLGL